MHEIYQTRKNFDDELQCIKRYVNEMSNIVTPLRIFEVKSDYTHNGMSCFKASKCTNAKRGKCF
jgi:hypothetical protein